MGILDKRNFLVLGLGKSGRAVARLLAQRGYDVVAYDDDAERRQAFVDDPALASVQDAVDVADDSMVDVFLRRSDVLVVSPGVPLEHPVVRRARGEGVVVTGELEVAGLFADFDIVGVSGTNGKSTTVSIIGDVLRAAGRKTVVAGNIGTPLAEVVLQGSKPEIAVVEISSFQLDTVERFQANVAVLLNVTPDHLDRYHDSMDEYGASKARILKNADADTAFVYNDDDPICRSIAKSHRVQEVPFSSSRILDNGVYVEDGSIVRAWQGSTTEVLPRSEFTPIGVHNLENALAAVGAVTPLSIDIESLRNGLRGYRPLPHRMELVRVVDGVAYVNDSKATNVDAALKSIRSIEGHVVLLAGGLDKSGDFAPLFESAGGYRGVVLIGQATDKIERVIDGRIPVEHGADMSDAVTRASRLARAGDTVLLAPACASFDMFRSYEHRGESFRDAVKGLQNNVQA